MSVTGPNAKGELPLPTKRPPKRFLCSVQILRYLLPSSASCAGFSVKGINMNTRILALVGVAALITVGCDAYVKQTEIAVTLPDGLKDCKFFTVKPNTDASVLNIVRCPNSSTSVNYRSGKSDFTTVTVDSSITPEDQLRAVDEAYEAKRKEILAGIDLKIAELSKRKAELEAKK
jgi:hypothetical protein